MKTMWVSIRWAEKCQEALKVLNCDKQRKLKSQILDIAKESYSTEHTKTSEVWPNLSPDPIALVSNLLVIAYIYLIQGAKNSVLE